jgi:N-acetylmuramoyl-L-alanine amidase
MTKKRSDSGNSENPPFTGEGKMSTFGGPHDHGMGPNEGLALFGNSDLTNPKFADLFLPAPPPGTSGLGRRLNPDKYYLACRWNYDDTPREFLRNNLALVENPQNGRTAYAQPADWGPNAGTGRIADLSPGLAAALGVNTDDDVVVTIFADGKRAAAGAVADDGGHGSTNPHDKPQIKEFIQSPNHSSRNGAQIQMVVLHCTEASLDSTIKEFKSSDGRQVSAHYVIDRNGDIYQMVSDSDRANHCRGANQNSIGIEHVGKDSDSLAAAQAKSSARLVRWLLEQYNILRANVYGHDFAPGYDRSRGGTTCPDKLFGAAHNQETIAGWVRANV